MAPLPPFKLSFFTLLRPFLLSLSFSPSLSHTLSSTLFPIIETEASPGTWPHPPPLHKFPFFLIFFVRSYSLSYTYTHTHAHKLTHMQYTHSLFYYVGSFLDPLYAVFENFQATEKSNLAMFSNKVHWNQSSWTRLASTAV